MFHQRAGQRTKGIVKNQDRAADFGFVQLLQQILIGRFPRLQRVDVVRFRKTL